MLDFYNAVMAVTRMCVEGNVAVLNNMSVNKYHVWI